MSTQLDILALEPFFGGARRSMLETIVRYSRHRWTLLTLPPRRIERRLEAAAQWFAEQLSRHWVGRVDVLFASEAMNLANLFRLLPALSRQPTVVYFHDNQLPDADSNSNDPLDTVNLNTAMAATEIWFNSLYHLKSFVHKASALVGRHDEMSGLNPMPQLTAKAQLMPPPVDFTLVQEVSSTVQRNPRSIFVDTREADVELLNSALGILTRRNVKYQLITVGPVEGLDAELPRRTISERDGAGQIAGLAEAAIHVSARYKATTDHHAVRALSMGCWPIHPKSGVYPELLPAALHPFCLYDQSATALANRLHDVTTVQQPTGYEQDLRQILSRFDALAACRAIDQRLEQLAVVSSMGK